MSLEGIRARILVLSESHFPELTADEIKVIAFQMQSTDVFFNTNPGVFRGAVRKFMVRVNLKRFAEVGWPSDAAIDAILVHELAHISEYSKGSYRSYLKFILNYPFMSQANLQKMEQDADLVVLDKGHGKGLIEYRLWLETHLTPEELNKKMSRYYSPEEIEILLNEFSAEPHSH